MQHGWRRQRSTFRSVSTVFGRAVGWRWSHALLLYFVVVEAAVMPKHKRPYLLVLLHSSLWSLRHGEHLQGQSEPCRMSPFLDLSRSPSRFLLRSLSLDLWLSLSWHSADRGFCSKLCPKCLPHMMLVSAVLEWRSE